MFRVLFSVEAERELADLDAAVRRRVLKRLGWLASNLHEVRLEALAGGPPNLFKARVGDYRVLFDVYHDDQVILVHVVGHRSQVYRRR